MFKKNGLLSFSQIKVYKFRILKTFMLESLIRRSITKDVFFILLGSLAIVGFWRGIWNLLDYYLLVNNFFWSQIVSIVGGIIILLLISQLKVKNPESKKEKR